MKTIFYNLLFVLLMVPVTGTATDNPVNRKHTKTKKITKAYDVSPNATFLVENSYGNVDITSWDQNRIEVEVIIKTSGNDLEKVQEALDHIYVEFNSSPNLVSARTRFEKEDSSWWNIFSSSSNVNREINYIIKMPITNNADVSNDYGNININRLRGNAKLNCDYGRMIIGELFGENNELNFDYTKNSSIGYVKRAKINADYSGFEIDEAGLLELNADYTSSNVGKVTQIKFNCDYGSIHIVKAKKIIGNGDYLGTKIGSVHGELVLNLDYGSASIDKLETGTTNVAITSDYTGIKIGYDAQLPFKYAVNTSYANVSGIDHMNSTSSEKGKYSGYHLTSNTGNTISINSSYGNINFNRK